MLENEDIKIKRFKIIEPFLKKEKKLREIEKESGVSYATLKRWIKAYKENGIIGLDKKEREDKNSFKSIDTDGIKLIKTICNKNDEANISKLYSRCKEKLLEKNYEISYPTFYRIVNNIDDFFKKTSNFHIKKIKKENQIYIVIEIPTYILVDINSERKSPNLIVMFDAATLEVINYEINFEISNIYSILGFIRQSILKNSSIDGTLIKPKEVLIDCELSISKAIAKNIFNLTSIKIMEYSHSENEFQRFMNFLKEDLYKEYLSKEKFILYEELLIFLDNYIYLDKNKYNYAVNYKLLEKEFVFRELDVFLQSSTRKIYSSSLRFRNFLYKDNILKSLNGLEIEIKFNPIHNDIIHLFSNGKFIGMLEY